MFNIGIQKRLKNISGVYEGGLENRYDVTLRQIRMCHWL